MSDEAFGDQMVAQMPYLRAFAISLCGSHSLADDLVQDTLVKAWSHADSFQPKHQSARLARHHSAQYLFFQLSETLARSAGQR